MALELTNADMLTGGCFLDHPDMPTVAVLRLDTRGEPRWILATEKGLRELAKQCLEKADELKTVQ